MLVILIVSLLLCCMGFKKFVWFMSIGYGLSSAGIGAAMLIIAIIYLVKGTMPFDVGAVLFMLQSVLFIIYGIRLGGFLLIRELKNEKYRAKLAEAGGDAKVPVFVGAFMWIFCGVLYIIQSFGPITRLLNVKYNDGALFSIAAIIGIVISIVGILFEGIADKQKSAEKAKNPNMPAMNGLFKMCRCPNYFGEILFWTGAFVSGVATFKGVGQWIVACLGFIIIVAIMLSGAKRLETRHIKHYGQSKEYQEYANKTPLIIPLIPLYHMTSPEKIAKEEAAKKAKAEKKAKGNK